MDKSDKYFTGKTCLQKSHILETNGKGWRKEDLTVLEKGLVKIRLKLFVLKTLGPNWIYPKSAERNGQCHFEGALNL